MKLIKRHFFNGFWVLFINFFRQILSITFLIQLVRVFDQDVVGQYQFVNTVVGIAGMFTFSGLGQSVIQSVARGYPGTFRLTLIWRLAGSFVSCVGIVIFALLFNENQNLRESLLVAALLFPLVYGLSGWTNFQTGEGKFKLNAIWQGVAFLLSYGGTIIALWLCAPSITWLIVIMNSALAIINLIAIQQILSRIPRGAVPEPGALQYGLQVSLWGVANKLGNYIDKILIFYFLSPAALAVFVIAERIPEIIKKYIQSMQSIFIPGFSRRKHYTVAMRRKVSLVSFALCVAISLVIFVFVPWVLPLAFTDAYDGAVFYSQLLCGTLILGQVAQTQMTFISSRFDAASIRNVTLISNLVRISASLALVPVFGIIGAIISTALYRLSTAIIMSLTIGNYYSSKLP